MLVLNLPGFGSQVHSSIVIGCINSTESALVKRVLEGQ